MKKKYKISKILLTILLLKLLFILVFAILTFINLRGSAGILKLIFTCFGLAFSFSWKTALGVWLILLILNGIGSATKTK